MECAVETRGAVDDHSPTCTCHEHPLPAGMRVRDGRDAYLAENGFTTEGYTSPTTKGSILGMAIRVPNPPAHQRGLRLHDLMHVATGYGTDHAGEAELSAWQMRRGMRGAGGYVTAIVAFNIVLGLVFAPRRTLAVAFGATGSGGSLFSSPLDYESLLDLTVGELRERLGIPPRGVASRPRGFHAHAPPRRASVK
jgi:hypothetical protein